MRISIFGSGYVGLVQAAIFADVGHSVICMDVDADRIERLRQGQVPFFEPGLSTMVLQGVKDGLLTFTHDTQTAVQNSDYLFICVGTPAGDDGGADLRYVMSVADGIAEHINGRKVIVNKSTVPVGTVDAVTERIATGLKKFGRDHSFEICSNPEFLKEGSAVADARRPDRIIVGAKSTETQEEFRRMYAAFNRNHDKLMFMDPRSAELTKYAANAMLEDFGSTENMKEAFINAGIGQFGSGWCWLVLNNGKLEITKTPNAENPIVHGHTPLLGCDVWEHSYYIDFRNRRPDYLKAFVDSLANWEFVASQLS